MSLNDYRDEVEIFLKKVNSYGKNTEQKINWLNNEFSLLKTAIKNSDKNSISHQIYDMMYLLFELSADFRCNLDEEWQIGNIKKEKYLNL